MGISGVTSARAGIVSGLLQTVAGQMRALGTSTRKDASTSGAAFLLSGAGTSSAPGAYTSTGLLLNNAKARSLSANSPIQSAAAKERTDALNSAAAKIKAGDMGAGRAQLEKLLTKNSKDTTALRFIGHSYLREQDYKKAEQYYARASSLAPSDAALRNDLGDARALQGSDDEVLGLARRKLKSPAHRAEGLKLLFRLSERSPGNTDAYLALADGFNAARKPRQELGSLQEAVRYADDGQIGDVISRAQRLTQQHGEVGLTHNLLGRALQKAGRYTEAIRELGAATKLAPTNLAYSADLADGYAARAKASLDTGDVAAAQSDLNAARGINPAVGGLGEVSARVALSRADRDITRGFYSRALASLRDASANAPDDTALKKKLAAQYVRVGVHFKDQGDNSQALANYEKAYALDPGSSVARRNVGELSHTVGLAAQSSSNYDQAIVYLQRAYDTYRAETTYGRDLGQAYDLRGQQRVSLNELTDAIEDFKKGLAVDPTNASLGANYASALAQQG